jgi:anthranilate phosphoribosyltransferase
MSELKLALKRLSDGESLDERGCAAAFAEVMRGAATPAQIAALLALLKLKGETIDEMVGAVRTLREFARQLTVDLRHAIDTCGTGGDGQGLFNVSTAVAFVAACGGAVVAKHGNRSVSSQSGSADVLEAFGVRIDLEPALLETALKQFNVAFLFAPAHHSATRHAAPVRRELGFRTLFNLIGPLSNPANVRRQVMGVYAPRWQHPVAETLKRLGSEHVLVVHSADGLDEISVAAPTPVVELRDGAIASWTIEPDAFGLRVDSLAALKVNDAASSAALIRAALHSTDGPAHAILALNAGAALYVSGRAATLAAGVASARDILASGAALDRLDAYARWSQTVVAQ